MLKISLLSLAIGIEFIFLIFADCFDGLRNKGSVDQGINMVPLMLTESKNSFVTSQWLFKNISMCTQSRFQFIFDNTCSLVLI